MHAAVRAPAVLLAVTRVAAVILNAARRIPPGPHPHCIPTGLLYTRRLSPTYTAMVKVLLALRGAKPVIKPSSSKDFSSLR